MKSVRVRVHGRVLKTYRKKEKNKMEELINKVKLSEGFRGEVYLCTAGEETIGYGTKLPIDQEEAELLLNHRLSKKINEVDMALSHLQIKDEAWTILYEMAYQLGVHGLLKFRNMIKALEHQDYLKAKEEMMDSKWYRQLHEADMLDGKDSYNRAEKLSDLMGSLA